MAAGHPTRGGQQRRPGGGQPRRPIDGGRVPAQPGPVLLPPRTTDDNGTAWTPGLLDAALADVPDALAAAPGGGHLLALLAGGQVQLSGPGGTGWMRLATRQTLAASAAGGRCALGRLTAAAFSPSGVPLLAGSCARPGTAGIFAYAGGTWHPAGPALPASYARQRVTVLRLTTTAGTTMALLAAGSGTAARLLATWSTGGGAHWVLSPPLPLRGAGVTSASSGLGGSVAVMLTGSHAQTITGPAGSWRQLPALPPGTATLAPVPLADGTSSPSTTPGSPSGNSRPAAQRGPPPRRSAFSSSSGHRANGGKSRSSSATGFLCAGGAAGRLLVCYLAAACTPALARCRLPVAGWSAVLRQSLAARGRGPGGGAAPGADGPQSDEPMQQRAAG
jgi:hypothetical protein